MAFSYVLTRAFLLVLGCAACFGASGDTSIGRPEVSKAHLERDDRYWKRYRNSELGYCVSYPSRWLRGEAFDGSGLYVETGIRRYSKPSGEIDIGPLATPGPQDARLKPASLNDDLEEHLAGLRKFARAEKVEVLEQRQLKVQGLTALYVKNQYYDPLERSRWMEEIIFVKRKGELFRLELQCAPEQIKRFEPVFAHLVESLEFECNK